MTATDISQAMLALAADAADRFHDDPARAVRLVGLVDVVRGYEGVKLENVERYRQNIGALEEEIPKLRAAIGEAEAALKTHRASATRE